MDEAALDSILTDCAEFFLDADRSDAQGIVEAMTQERKEELEAGIRALFAPSPADRVVSIVAFTTDDGMAIESVHGLPPGFTLDLVDRDA